LLESQSQPLAELLLAHAQKRSPQADTATNMHIDRIWFSGSSCTLGFAPAPSRQCHRLYF
ncbi:MAG: hypothetical protein KKB63_12700, partial [Alphaproteobacteria bacterium]|nr:hypothetical protein [Alphaproteobacteria bacterium]